MVEKAASELEVEVVAEEVSIDSPATPPSEPSAAKTDATQAKAPKADSVEASVEASVEVSVEAVDAKSLTRDSETAEAGADSDENAHTKRMDVAELHGKKDAIEAAAVVVTDPPADVWDADTVSPTAAEQPAAEPSPEESLTEAAAAETTATEIPATEIPATDRIARLEAQVATLQTALDGSQALIDQLQSKLQSQVQKTDQLQSELDDAKRYILSLTQSTDTAPANPSPASPPADIAPAANVTPRRSLSRPQRPISPPRSASLPPMPTDQLQGLPPMSSEQLGPAPAALSRTKRSPKPIPSSRPGGKRRSDALVKLDPLPPAKPAQSASQNRSQETESSKADAMPPKPKLSDSEIGWFD